MKRWYAGLFALAAIGALMLTVQGADRTEGWGAIKGQVVWDGEVPKPTPIDLSKHQDKAACTKKGELISDKLVVNPKSKGVRWCLVYLMDAKDFKKDIPIHPKLKEIKTKTVELDQPCCQFEPHLLAMRQGQTLLVKNSATIPHNTNITGVGAWPGVNPLVPAGGKVKVEDIPARYIPYNVACNIHPWMTGRLAVLKNPYFAVTDADGKFEIKDAPAGDFRLVISHDNGWVIGDTQPSKNGKKITIKDGETADLGKIPMKPSKD